MSLSIPGNQQRSSNLLNVQNELGPHQLYEKALENLENHLGLLNNPSLVREIANKLLEIASGEINAKEGILNAFSQLCIPEETMHLLKDLNEQIKHIAEQNPDILELIKSHLSDIAKSTLQTEPLTQTTTPDSNAEESLKTSKKLAKLLMSQGIGKNSFALDKDSQNILIGIFESLRPQYPTEFAAMDNEFTNEKAGNFVLTVIQNIFFQNIMPTLLQEQSSLPVFFQELLGFAIERKMPSWQELENLKPAMSDFQEQILTDHQQATGKVASSLEEMIDQKSVESCKELILTISPDCTVDAILEHLLRDVHFHSFYKVLSEEITQYNPEAPKSKTLEFLDALIKNYISPAPSKFWRTHPDFNFHYALSQLDQVIQNDSLDEIHYLYNRMETANKEILPALEAVLQGFSKASTDVETLKEHLPWILFGDSDNISAFMRKVGMKKGNNWCHAALSGFLEGVVEQVSSQSENPEEIQLIRYSLHIMNVLLFTVLNRLPTLEEIGLTLTPLQEELLAKILEIYDLNAQNCFKNARELLEVVKPEAEIKRAPMLGIGFSGPCYEPHSTSERDHLYLNFSSQFRSRGQDLGGLPILFAIRTLLTHQMKEKLPYQIHILDNLGETDNQLFTYITHQLIDAFCQSPDTLNFSLRDNLKVALLQSLRNKLESQNKRKSTCESHIAKRRYAIKNNKRETPQGLKAEIEILKANNAILEQLIDLIEGNRFLEIEKAHRSLLKTLLDEAERRICVETVITQSTGNPYTLSFARKPEMGDPVLMDGVPYKFGDNFLIQPCLTRCQMLGVAHTLLGDLKHLPSVQQAHERSLKRDGDGIQPVVPDNCVIS